MEQEQAIKAQSSLRKAIRLLSQRDYDSPEEAYERSVRNEPGFDPGPRREPSEYIMEEIKYEILDILEGRPEGMQREEMFEAAISPEFLDKFDDDIQLWMAYTDVLADLVEEGVLGETTVAKEDGIEVNPLDWTDDPSIEVDNLYYIKPKAEPDALQGYY